VSTVKPGTAGATRTCPHCRATILESSSVCPACRHHLRFDPKAQAEERSQATAAPLVVEGKIKHPSSGEPWEYTVLVTVRNEKGEEVARQLVGVGALRPDEERTFSLTVEVRASGGLDALRAG
jgi:hypothetical protein